MYNFSFEIMTDWETEREENTLLALPKMSAADYLTVTG
jgi:hypothetical protein